MRVAYLGNFEPRYSTENIVARALEANGHEVDRIQEGATRALDVAMRVEQTAPALFMWTQTYGLAVSGGSFDDRHTMLAAIKGQGVPTVGYHLDKWWCLDREDQVRSGEAFFAVDRLCTADGGDHDWAGAGIEHRWFPPGVDEAECVPGDVRRELECGVTFVGGWAAPRYNGKRQQTGGYHAESTHRHELIRHLQRKWRRQLRLVPRDGRTRVNGQALRDVYASAKVVVGDSCLVPNAPRYWSDRIPETVGRGGFLLHPWVEGLDEHFTDGEHMRMWTAGDWGQLDELVAHYIANPDEARATAEAGRLHVIEHHTYTVRMRQLEAMLRAEGLLRSIAPTSWASTMPPWLVGERGPEVFEAEAGTTIVVPEVAGEWTVELDQVSPELVAVMLGDVVPVAINGRPEWTLLLPKHRADRPEWPWWEATRIASMAHHIGAGDVVYDVGAEEGDMPALWAKWGAGVVLFEPNDRVWSNIKSIWDANGLTPPLAAFKGFAADKDRRHTEEFTAGRWFTVAEGPVIHDHGFLNLCERPDVASIRIDTMATMAPVPTAITIDVEGAELEVLRGARETLRHHRPKVWVSIHPEFMLDMYGHADGVDLVRTLMAELDYDEQFLAIDHEHHWMFLPR